MTPDEMQLQTIHSRLDKQDEVLQEIRGALVGNAALGHKGIVSRVETLERDTAEHGRKLILAGGVILGLQAGYQFVKSKLGGG